MTAAESENISDHLAAGAVTVIENDGQAFPLPPFGPRSTKQLDHNRVEVIARNFYRASDQMNYRAGDAKPYYNHRRGNLVFTVVTQRQSLTSVAPANKHGEAIGRIRWLMSRIAQKMLPDVIGGYQIVDLIDNGDTYARDETEQTDRTEMRFQVDLLITPDNYGDS